MAPAVLGRPPWPMPAGVFASRLGAVVTLFLLLAWVAVPVVWALVAYGVGYDRGWEKGFDDGRGPWWDQELGTERGRKRAGME